MYGQQHDAKIIPHKTPTLSKKSKNVLDQYQRKYYNFQEKKWKKGCTKAMPK